jgi:hypothetical protein
MNIPNILLKWCAVNGRALVTPEERQQIMDSMTEVTRVQGHYAHYAVGKAYRDFKAVRHAYNLDPSDEKLAKLDKVKATWPETDLQNAIQRGLINLTLVGIATKAVKAICPAIARRAAQAMDQLARERAAAEKAMCAEFEHPFSKSELVLKLSQQAESFRSIALRIENEHFETNCGPAQYCGLEWIQDLLPVQGQVEPITEPVEHMAATAVLPAAPNVEAPPAAPLHRRCARATSPAAHVAVAATAADVGGPDLAAFKAATVLIDPGALPFRL